MDCILHTVILYTDLGGQSSTAGDENPGGQNAMAFLGLYFLFEEKKPHGTITTCRGFAMPKIIYQTLKKKLLSGTITARRVVIVYTISVGSVVCQESAGDENPGGTVQNAMAFLGLYFLFEEKKPHGTITTCTGSWWEAQ